MGHHSKLSLSNGSLIDLLTYSYNIDASVAKMHHNFLDCDTTAILSKTIPNQYQIEPKFSMHDFSKIALAQESPRRNKLLMSPQMKQEVLLEDPHQQQYCINLESTLETNRNDCLPEPLHYQCPERVVLDILSVPSSKRKTHWRDWIEETDDKALAAILIGDRNQ